MTLLILVVKDHKSSKSNRDLYALTNKNQVVAVRTAHPERRDPALEAGWFPF